MAGLGKTSLANHITYRLQSHFADGILWVALEQTNTMSALYGLAAAYGESVADYSDLATRSAKVRELLASKKALLVLDNATSDGEIRPLLPPSGNCAVLITSRRQDLAVLDTAYRINLEPFDTAKQASLALFAQILGQERVDQKLAQFQQMADLLGHLPLAIDIAANRLKHEPGWTTEQMLSRWQAEQSRLAILVRGDQAVQLSFDVSFQCLSEPDQALFTLLGLFVGPDFSVELAAALAQRPYQQIADGLRRLFSYSLLQAGGNGRYRLHPLLREYARTRCEESQHQHFAKLFLDYAHQNAAEHQTLEQENSNIFAALAIAQSRNLHIPFVDAVIALFPFWQSQGYLEQAYHFLQQAETAARCQDYQKGLILVLHHQGFTAMKQGQPGQAELYYQEALDLARQVDDRNQTSELLLKLGALAHRHGQFEDAAVFYNESLTLARELDNQSRVGGLLINLGLVAAVQGEVDKAAAYYEESLAIVKAIENSNLTIIVLQNLGSLVDERGDYAQAKTYYQEGLTLAETLNDPELRSRILGNLGLVACNLGNFAEAAAYFRTGLALAEKSNLTVQICRQQANLGYVAVLRGQYHQANIHYQAALQLARELDFPEDLSVILNQMGDCAVRRERYGEAAGYYEEAGDTAVSINLARETAFSQYGLAQLAAQRGNVEEARRLGRESQQTLADIKHKKANEVWWWLRELPGEVKD
jgi:tetratricopeptide (TPR) repeat protein